jgi:hypothetical protein
LDVFIPRVIGVAVGVIIVCLEKERVDATRALGSVTYVRNPYVIDKLGLAVRRELDWSA